MSFLRKVGEEQHRNFSFLLSAAVPGPPYSAAPVHQERCVFKIYKVKKNSVVNGERSLSPQNSLKQKETTKKNLPSEILITKLSPVRVFNVVIKVRQTCQKCQKRRKKLLKFFFRQITALQLFILVKTSNSKKSVSE